MKQRRFQRSYPKLGSYAGITEFVTEKKLPALETKKPSAVELTNYGQPWMIQGVPYTVSA
jgi:hypothetical protein